MFPSQPTSLFFPSYSSYSNRFLNVLYVGAVISGFHSDLLFLHWFCPFYSIFKTPFPFPGVKTVAGVPAHCLAEGAVKVTGGVFSIFLDCP